MCSLLRLRFASDSLVIFFFVFQNLEWVKIATTNTVFLFYNPNHKPNNVLKSGLYTYARGAVIL